MTSLVTLHNKKIKNEHVITSVSLTILLTSDFHGRPELLESAVEEASKSDYDIFVNLGDYTDQEYAQKLFEQVEIPAIGCTGNRDMFFEDEFLDSEVPVYNFLDADVDEDYKIILAGGDFPDDVGDQISSIIQDHGDPSKVVVGTHFPPKKANDRIKGGRRIGFDKFREILMREKPAVWASGHVHEDFGKTSVMGTTCLNASSEATGKAYKIVLADEGGVKNLEEVTLVKDIESNIV